jgi:hypothetical protein
MYTNKAIFAVLGIALYLASAAGVAQDVQAARAVLKGPENRLFEFHEHLMDLLGNKTMEKLAIACDACPTLSENETEVKEITYVFFRDDKRLKAFARAWGKSQTAQTEILLTMTFDMIFAVPDCSQMKQPCVSAPFCPPPKCDTVRGAPCVACTPLP